MKVTLVVRYERGEYKIATVINTVEFKPGEYLSKDKVNALINISEITVVVTR